MSKTKMKKARREAKRNDRSKAAAHHRKLTKNSKPAQPQLKSNATLQSSKKAKAGDNASAGKKRDLPFDVYDNILLVGEGDFTFASSLALHHGCASITATSYDSRPSLLSKYPSASSTISSLSALTPPVPFHHSIDATKLSTYKPLKLLSPFDLIIFNFPHTGGLSTDVNRQVRANQKLLVEFFTSSLPLLREGGRVLVTLFEGEPYTLWNVKDLARHAGLRVVESFKFDWDMYPGYKHVRTLGLVEGEGAWKGEERSARSYVFEKPVVKKEDAEQKAGKSKKRKKGESDDESSNDD